MGKMYMEWLRSADGQGARLVVALLATMLAVAGVTTWAAGTEPPGIATSIRNASRRPSTFINARVLAANTAETVTAPTFATYPSARAIGLFSGSCSNWYYSATGTAAVPVADVTDGGAAARSPIALTMAQGGTISVVADATCVLTTEWYVGREP